MIEERAALSQLAYVFKVLCSAYDAWRSDGGGELNYYFNYSVPRTADMLCESCSQYDLLPPLIYFNVK